MTASFSYTYGDIENTGHAVTTNYKRTTYE